MKISIAIATYNGADFIPKQLDSIADQTIRPDEVIVADDGSTDATLDIVRGFAKTSGIAVTVLPNTEGNPLRPPRNFERALRNSTGDLVFCCDQDDFWDTPKIAFACAALEARLEVACFLNNARFCDPELRPTGQDKLGKIRASGLPDESFVMGCCAAFRKSFIDIALPIPDEITHDGWLVGLSDLLSLTERSAEVLQSYRIHGSNVSKGFFVNASHGVGPLRLALRRLRARVAGYSSNGSLLRELLFVSAAEERLSSRGEQIRAAFPNAEIDGVLADLVARRQRLEMRREIRKARLGERFRLLRNAFRRGDYSGRKGALNALKDSLIFLAPDERFTLWQH